MYLFYQHHRDARGKLVLTEIKLSSSKEKWFVSFKSPTENAIFEICKTLLKAPPSSVRSYEPGTNIWSYLEYHGETVIQHIKDSTKPIGGVVCLELEDLAAQAARGTGGRIDLPGSQGDVKRMKAEEFFYNHGTPTPKAAWTKQELQVKIRETISFAGVDCPGEPDKRAYRAAAMRLHPDRNNGDGSKMSELNMLWQMYNGGAI